MTESEVTLEQNWYVDLGLPLGAPATEVEDAYQRLAARAEEAGDTARLARLDAARIGLTHEGMRAFHNQKIKWAAAGEWYRKRYPNGRSVEEHRLWGEYRRELLEDDPGWWRRLRGAAAP